MIPEVCSPSSSSVQATSCCTGCGLAINEKYIYRVLPDMQWHESCLKCCECGVQLGENSTCFVKNGKAYCKQDYSRLFAYKCHRCGVGLKSSDLVMKCMSKMFHIDCFSCSHCHRKLVPGDEYKLSDDQLFCKDDAPLTIPGDCSTAATMPHLTSLLSQTSTATSHMMLSAHPLYLNYSSSSMPITPEYSNASVSSPSFSPTTTSSSSSSSSIVDSPSSSNHFSSNMGNLSISSSSTNPTGNNHAISSFNSTNPSSFSSSGNKFDLLNDFDYNNIKEEGEAESVSDDENNIDDVSGDEEVDADDDDSNLNESMSEESSFNESSGSFGNDKSLNKRTKKKPGHKSDKTPKFKTMGNTSSPLVNRPNMMQLNHLGSSAFPGQPGHRQPKPARIRTVLNEKQLQTLRACYNANPRPDAILKEHLVEITGLNPRVIRVWFQNKRCKDKKRNMLVRPDGQHHSGLQLPVHNHQFHMTSLANHHHQPLIGGSNSTNNGFPQQQQQHLLYDNCF